jgi:hypothetical protein
VFSRENRETAEKRKRAEAEQEEESWRRTERLAAQRFAGLLR